MCVWESVSVCLHSLQRCVVVAGLKGGSWNPRTTNPPGGGSFEVCPKFWPRYLPPVGLQVSAAQLRPSRDKSSPKCRLLSSVTFGSFARLTVWIFSENYCIPSFEKTTTDDNNRKHSIMFCCDVTLATNCSTNCSNCSTNCCSTRGPSFRLS